MAKGKPKKDKDVNDRVKQFINYYGRPIDSEVAEQQAADWQAVDSTLLVGAIHGVTRQGGAVMFGSDRSGFLYSVTVYFGGERVSKYFHPEREFEVLNTYLVALYELGQ
jgi:hypothetical protein